MIVKVSSSSLRVGRWYEYLVRFVLGGAATAFTGLVSSRFGPSIGGLFLALPAIFCASATLIEKHEIRRKRKTGASGQKRGRQAAALDAAGAAIGSIGMLVFALIFWLIVERHATAAFALALSAWGVISVLMWWVWRHFRISMHRHPNVARRHAAADRLSIGANTGTSDSGIRTTAKRRMEPFATSAQGRR